MKSKILVFGNGLLGSSFASVPNAVILGREDYDITRPKEITAAINRYKPDAVVNCAGVVPKSPATIERMFKTNAFAPHYIADACEGRLPYIHISTDCVFDGETGNHDEHSRPNATNMYGMSKVLGEPLADALVIRTSFIGLPDPKGRGLLAWASQQDEVVGYDRVFWNGVTTPILVRQILHYLNNYTRGVRHLYSYTVSKHELLVCAKEVFGWNYTIYPESDKTNQPHFLDRTLTSIYTAGFIPIPLKQQLEELKHDLYK